MKNDKPFLILFFIFFCYHSFCQNLLQIKDDIIKNNIDDSICFKDLERAIKDFETNGIVYVISENDYELCGDINLFESFLRSVNIKPIRREHSSIITKKNNTYCYEEFMNKIISQKYGDKMILNALNRCDSLYVLSNPDKIYSSLDSFDSSFYYPNAKNINKQSYECVKDFFSTFKYPKKFVFGEGGSSRSKVTFILSKEGRVRNMKIETFFSIKDNIRYLNYFENRIKKFIKNIEWKPRKKRNLNINSEVHLTFFYKRN